MTTYTPTWILVADASRARLFQYSGFGAEIEQLKEWDHPKSRARNSELVTDRPGRVMQSHGGPHGGHGSHSGMEPHTAPKDVEHEVFARQLTDELGKGLRENAYGRLILVANPAFLGTLRQVSDEQVHKHTVASVAKDYTSLPLRELQNQLSDVIHS